MTALNKQALREKFEAWAEEAGALPWGHLKKQRTASGNYSVQIYTYMWHAWNACHEAFLDELEAAEKRIADLTGKPAEEYADDDELLFEIDFCDDLSTSIQVAQWLKELRIRRAAGIGVKGE